MANSLKLGSESPNPLNLTSFITVATGGSGEGGDVTINVSGKLEIAGNGLISAATARTGDAGSITLDAGSVVIGGGGRINAETTGRGTAEDKAGNAGDITLHADSVEIRTGGTISTNSLLGQVYGGNAGNIACTASRAP